jgi:hypothetical protein
MNCPATIGARFQFDRGAQDAFPQIVGRSYCQAHGLAFLFRDGQYLREEQLFDGAEKLVRRQIVFAGRRAAQQPHVQHDDLRFLLARAPQRRFQMVERVVGADRHQDVSRRHAYAGPASTPPLARD